MSSSSIGRHRLLAYVTISPGVIAMSEAEASSVIAQRIIKFFYDQTTLIFRKLNRYISDMYEMIFERFKFATFITSIHKLLVVFLMYMTV